MFKRKQERSEWLEGLLAAENDVESCGYEHCRWASHDTRIQGFDYYITEFMNGYDDYLAHYKNNLKNILS